MRLGLKYFIDIIKFYKSQDIGCVFFSPTDYYLVKESLSYTKVLSEQKTNIKKFSVGFFMDAVELEKELKDKSFIFRESLKIRDEELQKLISMPASEKKVFVEDCLHLQLFINEVQTKISDVSISNSGISVDLVPQKPIKENRFEIEIGFMMPQVKMRSEFLVSIPEPTYSPDIVFTYNPKFTKITAYQFLNDDSKLIQDAAAIHGRITINPKGWVYPVKGLLFIIEDIDNHNV